ncbi:hypothetical protein AAG906_004763 [Vitis piasezkii]
MLHIVQVLEFFEKAVSRIHLQDSLCIVKCNFFLTIFFATTLIDISMKILSNLESQAPFFGLQNFMSLTCRD